MYALNDRIRHMPEEAVANGEIAGANLLVLHGGREIVYTQAGFADVEHRRPYNRDTIARLYSMSKPVTAAAAMILVERGQLDLGSALGDYIPAFRDMLVWENEVTVLLTCQLRDAGTTALTRRIRNVLTAHL